MSDAFLPAGFATGRLAARIGLLSDTHLPDRLRSLPDALATIFQRCDVILHAGDVGELRVLDELSRIAPVIAVHGNDDTAEAQRELPEQQVLAVAGRRILLWHSHARDRASELRLREPDAWPPVLARIRQRAEKAGATVAVFGHTHVPLQYEENGVLLVNPGALASGNPYIRQRLKSVALLFVRDDGAITLRHVNLSTPQRVFIPRVDWQASFTTAHDAVSESILEPELMPFANALRRADFADADAVKESYYRLAHRCWSGAQELITAADVLVEIGENSALPAADRRKIQQLLDAS